MITGRNFVTGTATGATAHRSARSTIRVNATLNLPVAQGNVSVTMLQYANIAHFTGRKLALDPAKATIVEAKDTESMKRRTYEKGREPRV